MKATHLLAVLFLFVASLHTSFALLSVSEVTKERAEDLGIEVRVKPGGPRHAWLELEFQPEGELAKFQHVSLEITDGDQLRLGWTPLKDERTSSGSVIVRLMGSRAFLKKVTLRIVHGDFGGAGEDVRVEDFLNLEKLDGPESSDESESAVKDGADQPAPAVEPKAE